MTAEQFAYWLHGYVEINGSAPTEDQWTVIKDHLAETFVKLTPERKAAGPSQMPEGITDILRNARSTARRGRVSDDALFC